MRANLKAGADHIKLFVTGGVSSRGTDIYAYHYSREEIRAAVEEAHRAGRKVAAHAHGRRRRHPLRGRGGGFGRTRRSPHRREHRQDAPSRHPLVPHQHHRLSPRGYRKGRRARGDPSILSKMQQVRETIEGTFERIRALGSMFRARHRLDARAFRLRARVAVDHGVSPEEAIIAATRRGAEVMGQEDVGTLEPGKRADVVVLKRNPLEISALFTRFRPFSKTANASSPLGKEAEVATMRAAVIREHGDPDKVRVRTVCPGRR